MKDFKTPSYLICILILFLGLFFAFTPIAEAATSWVFLAPPGIGSFVDSKGNVWTPDVNGMVTVTDSTLVRDFHNAGFILLPLISTPTVTHNYNAGATDWTLSATEALAADFLVTNAGGAINAVLPSGFQKVFHVKNTSGYTVTFKYASGGTTTLITAKQAVMFADGTAVMTIVAAY